MYACMYISTAERARVSEHRVGTCTKFGGQS